MRAKRRLALSAMLSSKYVSARNRPSDAGHLCVAWREDKVAGLPLSRAVLRQWDGAVVGIRGVSYLPAQRVGYMRLVLAPSPVYGRGLGRGALSQLPLPQPLSHQW